MTTERYIQVEDHGGVRVLRLDRPAALNAISRTLGHQLIAEFERADADAEVRAVVLTGTGERAFSAGGDLKERISTDETAEDRAHFAHALLERRRSTPSIAAINGLAYGGGLELLLSCDFAIAAPHARFALPEATRGILASGGGVVRLPQAVGRARALRLALTGEPIDAATAQQWGLIIEVTPAPDLLPRAIELGHAIAAAAPLAVDASRRVIDAACAEDDGWRANNELRTIVGASADAIEGPRAFAERRPAVWQGR